MAIVHKGEATLFWESVACFIKGSICLVAGTLLFDLIDLVLLAGIIGLEARFIIYILAIIASLKVMGYYIGRGKTFFQGFMGEFKVLQEFRKLSKEYHLFVGVRIHERMESDLVVVGPSGVFLVEIKNYVGTIEGTASDRHWILRKGRHYTKRLDNPLRQQKRNTFIISQYLRQEGCPVRVESCTLFPNINTIWRDRIPERCYRFTGTLVDNIREQRKKKELPKETIQRAVEALDKCVYGEPPMTEEEFEAKVNCSPSRGQ